MEDMKIKSRCEYGVKIIQRIDDEYKIGKQDEDLIEDLIEKYYDSQIEDRHTGKDLELGFSRCALPLVLHHNTPNNSIALLWSYEDENFNLRGLFPRVKRHGVV